MAYACKMGPYLMRTAGYKVYFKQRYAVFIVFNGVFGDYFSPVGAVGYRRYIRILILLYVADEGVVLLWHFSLCKTDIVFRYLPLLDKRVYNPQAFGVLCGYYKSACISVDTVAKGGRKALLALRIVLSVFI